MKTLRIIKYVLLAALVLALALVLHYHLPRTDVVRITGTEVKRVDRQDPGTAARTRDVRYINTVTRDGDIRVFRNEDTGWGWPPYFKFDSADLTALAQTIAQSPEDPWVRVRYYGWRIKILSLFPNAVDLEVVDREYTHVPVFNIVFLTLLAAALIWLLRVLRRWSRRLRESERYRALVRRVEGRRERD